MRRKMFLMLTISLLAIMFSTAASAQQKFIGHLNGNQEVPPTSSTGTGICTVTLNAAETQITVATTFSGLSSAANAGHIHDQGPVGVTGPVRFPFTGVSGTSGTLGPFTFAVTAQQVADLRAKKWYCNIHTVNFGGGEIRGQVKPTNTVFDLDGDGRTDITVFRQSANAFYTLSSVNNSLIFNRFGSGASDNWLNSTSDYDGDGRGDPLLIKLNQTTGGGFWSILQSGNNTIRTVEVGNFFTANAERLVPGDYDGDGKEDPAVFRSGTGVWYILQSSTNTLRSVPNFGAVNDIPSVGDFDKDSIIDLTVVRSEGGQLAWYTLLSTTGQSVRTVWGSPTDGITFFAKIDVDGDGAQDRMTTRTVSGQTQFNILRSSDGGQVILTWGLSTDSKLYGDYDGDGKTDFVARRTVGGQLIWYILLSSTSYDPAQARAVQWGITGDQ
jgi:hypothetical protein